MDWKTTLVQSLYEGRVIVSNLSWNTFKSSGASALRRLHESIEKILRVYNNNQKDYAKIKVTYDDGGSLPMRDDLLALYHSLRDYYRVFVLLRNIYTTTKYWVEVKKLDMTEAMDKTEQEQLELDKLRKQQLGGFASDFATYKLYPTDRPLDRPLDCLNQISEKTFKAAKAEFIELINGSITKYSHVIE